MLARVAQRMTAVVLGGGLAAATLAGCHVNVADVQHRTRSYPVTGQVRTLVVNAHVGSVHVTGGGSGEVRVTEHLTFRNTAPVTSHRLGAGTLTLDSRCPGGGVCGVSYDVTLPRSAAVRVTDNAGSIGLRSLSGRVTAHTNAGSINLDSLSGPILVTNHAGSINGGELSCPQATLRASVGTIKATFTAAPAKLVAAASVGAVTLRLPGTPAYAVNASATVGNVNVSVRRSPSSPHAVTASTKTGPVTVEPAS